MPGRVRDVREVSGTPGRTDTAFGTTGLGIILSILAVAINTHNFRVKSWPEGHRPERSNADEEEPEGSNSAQQHQEEAGVSDSAQGVTQLAPTVCASSSSLGHSCPHSLGGCKARTEMEPVKATRVWQKDKTLSWQLTILRLMGMQDPAVHWPRQQPCATPSPQSFCLAAGLAGTPMASPPGGHCDKGGLNTPLLAAIEQEPIPAIRATSATSAGRTGQTEHRGQLDDSDRSQIQTDDNRSTQR